GGRRARPQARPRALEERSARRRDAGGRRTRRGAGAEDRSHADPLHRRARISRTAEIRVLQGLDRRGAGAVKAATTAYTLAAVLLAGWFITDGAIPNVVGPLNETRGDCVVDQNGAHLWFEGRDPFGDAWLKEVGMPQFGHPPTTPFWFLFLYHYTPKQAHGITGVMALLML